MPQVSLRHPSGWLYCTYPAGRWESLYCQSYWSPSLTPDCDTCAQSQLHKDILISLMSFVWKNLSGLHRAMTPTLLNTIGLVGILSQVFPSHITNDLETSVPDLTIKTWFDHFDVLGIWASWLQPYWTSLRWIGNTNQVFSSNIITWPDLKDMIFD